MPMTINGIGTHYYGRRNLQSRPGVCGPCGREVMLRSYETRLWFVVLFIPIIPLGRKQIIDECSRCSRHRAIPLEQWEKLKEEVVEESRRHAETVPGDVQAALDHLRAVASLKAPQEALRTAQEVLARFGHRADVQMAAGSCYDDFGMVREATDCFERALAIDPGDPDARWAVALGRIERGDLDDARQLLDWIDRDGRRNTARARVLLARALQKQGRHEDALDAFREALKRAPSLARDGQVRKAVRASEGLALGAEPVLPAAPFWRRPAVLVSGILGLAALGVFGVNQFIASQRPLHVVNGLVIPATVRLDGRKPLALAPGEVRKVHCGEGRHEAVVTLTGGEPETVEFDVKTGWFARFYRRPTFVLNVGGAALIAWEDVIYSDRPGDPDVPYELYCGEAFLAFDHVHYPFTDPPREIEYGGPGDIRKSHLFVVEQVDPVDALNAASEDLSPEAIERFVRSHLTARPDSDALLRYYAAILSGSGRRDELRTFLEPRLDDRPIRIEWHRHYQEACDASDRWNGLAAMYDRWLGREPGNAALLYLRGRLIEDPDEAMSYHERAMAADPSSPYPHLAKAWHLRSAGDFAGARRAMERACRLRPDDPQMRAQLNADRLALGEIDALVDEIRRERREAPLLWPSHARLLELLIAKGDLAGARRQHRVYVDHVRKEMQGDPLQLALNSEVHLLALEGRYEACLKKLAGLSDTGLVEKAAFRCRLELGQLDAAEEAVSESGDPYALLTVSVARHLAGQRERAAVCRRRAAKALADGDRYVRRLRALLAENARPAAADLRACSADPLGKALTAVALAQAHPDRRESFLDLAETFNARPLYPHALLKRAVEQMRRPAAARR